MSLKQDFLDYLESKDMYLGAHENDRIYNFVKIPYNSTIDLIYTTYNFYHSILPSNKLENCGFYDKKNKKLYDISYQVRTNILGLDWDDNTYPSKEKIKDELNDKVSNCVTDYVLDNKNEFYESVKDYVPNIDEYDVKKNFIYDIKEIIYKAKYNSDNEKDVLDYITNGDNFVHKKASEYCIRNKEQIGKELYDIDKKNELLTNIWNDKNNSLYKVKDIVNAIKDGNYGNVHIFIHKNGLNFDFKYDASTLEYSWDCGYLPSYHMPAQDRNNFESLFGRNENFNYKDITKIEYRNNPIYIDKDFRIDDEEKDNLLNTDNDSQLEMC